MIVKDKDNRVPHIGSNYPGISRESPRFLTLVPGLEDLTVCPRSKLVSCTMSRFLLQMIRMSHTTCRTVS